MGTPLPHPEYQKDDGTPYLSGTEWEYLDAVTAERAHGKPITLIYRRTEEPPVDRKDRKALAQYHAVLDFFDQFRDPNTGALIGGVNEYRDPEDLRQKLVNHLRVVIDGILTGLDSAASAGPALSSPPPLPRVAAPPLWEGSPFPGLRAFMEQDAPIFLGRGQETSELVKRVATSRFVGVVAASGSGKSSLVAAGLIPRLRAGAIVTADTNSKEWRVVRLTPGTNPNGGPFAALFMALCEAFPEHAVSPFMLPQEKRAFVDSISADPNTLIEIGEALLREAKAPTWAEILFFVDQFEELFTVVKPADRALFVALLDVIQRSKRLRCIVTMRSDFYADCLELPVLAGLLKEGTYPLAVPTAGALYEMITRPAERAGLTWDEGLPGRILNETGSEAGALALMAYALDELYNASQGRGDKRLTFDAYAAIGGVEGAIGKRAEAVFAGLTMPDKDRLLQRVFRELVTVNPTTGAATRQRAAASGFSADEMVLIHALADARLLVTYDHTVEVAHEAVFRSWERLRCWIVEAQEDLILLRQVRSAAEEWARRGQPDFLRWPAERLTPVYEMLRRQEPSLNEIERDFIEPEQERLLREIDNIATDHKRRRWIGERLATIGDTRSGIGVARNGIPQIDWLPVELGGQIEIEGHSFTVQPFYVAKYLITYLQFQTFLDAPDGFEDARWWQDFPDEYVKQPMSTAVAQYDNYPRDSVSWYQSVAFARWLNAKYHEYGLFEMLFGADQPSPPTPLPTAAPGEGPGVRGKWELRLPMEWEWEWMAQSGTETREYPWGDWDDKPRANTREAGLGDRSTAVGMYPHGVAYCGAFDVAGNLWEWCQNDYKDLTIINGFANNRSKVLRGGSFDSSLISAACACRDINYPSVRNANVGLRLVVAPLPRL
jgi:formylglycine-generating enzyme required for sulfatase activity